MGIERSPQLRGDRSVAVAIGDCWLWLIMAENNVFKGNYRTKTNICDSKQQPYADKSPETPPTDRVTRTSTKKQSPLSINSELCFKYSERESNPHGHYWPQDFKSGVSTYSTIRALICGANVQLKIQNAKFKMQNRRTKQEQRVLAHYALQEGGKALEEGLMQNAKLNKIILNFEFWILNLVLWLHEPK